MKSKLNRSNKPKDIKLDNLRSIISQIQQNEAISATEISNKIDLSKTSVAKALNELYQDGIIKQIGKGKSTSTGGKKPDIFSINENYKYIISTVFSSCDMQVAIFNMRCEMIGSKKFKFSNQESCSYRECMKTHIELIHELIKEYSINIEKILAIVVNCYGVVDAKTGIIHMPMKASWRQDLNVKADLLDALGFQCNVYVDNAVRFSGYSELLGNSKFINERIAILGTTITGTGGCFINMGSLLYGRDGLIGEVGHIVVDPHSESVCSCGNKGCFETKVSLDAVLNYAYSEYKKFPKSIVFEKADNKDLELSDILEAGHYNDEFAMKVIDRIAKYYAIVINNIIMIQGPDRIIIQGLYKNAGDYFLNSIVNQVNAFIKYNFNNYLEIELSKIHGDDGSLIGAALYAINKFLFESTLDDFRSDSQGDE